MQIPVLLYKPALFHFFIYLFLAKVTSRIHGCHEAESRSCSDQFYVVTVPTTLLYQHKGLLRL